MRGTSDDWSSSNQDALGQLGTNEGIYVDTKGFKISKGAAKGDASKHVEKLGAREVADGAIIFRAGEKLYIVDGKRDQVAHPYRQAGAQVQPVRTGALVFAIALVSGMCFTAPRGRRGAHSARGQWTSRD